MRNPQGEIIKAVYTLLRDKVIAPNNNGAYNLSYIQRVTNDGGTVILSECLTETGLNTFVPVYSSESPDFDSQAYIYIYGLNTAETGPSDSFIYDCVISVKCCISQEVTTVSSEDLNTFGDTVANLMQPNSFAQISVSGFSVVDQQLQDINYTLPEVVDSKLEYSLTYDWLLRVEEV
jgi:hypothetical protein